jgi:hypothetical protein
MGSLARLEAKRQNSGVRVDGNYRDFARSMGVTPLRQLISNIFF